MDSIGNHFSDNDSKASFWKKNSKTVPGRPSPKKEIPRNRPRNASSSTSFQDFQESVSDAWDMGDDEFCVVSDVRISKRVAHSAAISVINSHRSSSGNEAKTNNHVESSIDSALSEERKTEAIQRLACQREVAGRHPSIDIFLGILSSFEVLAYKCLLVKSLLGISLLNLEDIRQLSWSGIPVKARAVTWKLLSGYLPANLERRQPVLERKRTDYWNLVKQYYDTERDEVYQDTYRQIHIDIPRMSPLIALFQQKTVQEMFERILFIWAIRHPASGYVQGINDLVTPFYMVFLQEVIPPGGDLESFDVASLPREQRDIIEADSFWCLSKFLDGIQDNYIFAQLGIQQKVNQLKELIQRIDGQLHRHLQQHGVDYLQFSFRWMNNLLTRELPLHCTIRLWDTYLAESDGFASFQLYVCAAFLLHWRRELVLQRDFQGLMLMLQNLPTFNWSNSEISMLVAEAYRLKYTFAGAPNHLQSGER
ncbi:hypothetical protein B566_EDAN009824 [Ephemera danica]|nr:hypothetical protein B566_EDAN009824 [Ephemera danica]